MKKIDDNKDNMFLGASSVIFKRAEELRKRMTKAEKILWEELKDKKLAGHKFRRQHPILKFVLDFYCHKVKLGIELDGEIHNSKPQKFYDTDRTDNLENYNIKIIRFHNDEVINDIDRVKEQILKEIKRRC